MTRAPKQRLEVWTVLGPGWLLLVYLIYAQGVSAIDYELGVAMGVQEPSEVVTEVGRAFWYGFAFADLLVYIPLLFCGLVGHGLGSAWGRGVLAAALGITVYWPVVCLVALVAARGADGWELANETAYWIVLPVISIWGGWGIGVLNRRERGLSKTTGRSPVKRAGSSFSCED